MIRITEANGVYEGKVEKLLNRQPDDDPDNLCRKCEGARKDQPIVGMTILWGLKKDGDQYSGGEILDPKNGKIYRAKMKLVDNGAKLEVRGFIGVSLFGRSQTWVRESDSAASQRRLHQRLSPPRTLRYAKERQGISRVAPSSAETRATLNDCGAR